MHSNVQLHKVTQYQAVFFSVTVIYQDKLCTLNNLSK